MDAETPIRLAWIRDPAHERVITEESGRASLALACEADRMAHSRVG